VYGLPIIRILMLSSGPDLVQNGLPSDAFSIDGAIAYLRALREPARSRAEEYLRKAPPQIQTPVRERARQELGWGDEPLPPDTLVEKCDAN
jgi:hypothetical protein